MLIVPKIGMHEKNISNRSIHFSFAVRGDLILLITKFFENFTDNVGNVSPRLCADNTISLKSRRTNLD